MAISGQAPRTTRRGERRNDRRKTLVAQVERRHDPKPDKGLGIDSAIISVCPEGLRRMEAEQLNQIAHHLANLKDRTADLRRYL
jgi:hypothetical protein